MEQLMFGHTEQVGSVLSFESCGAEVDEASDRAVLTAHNASHSALLYLHESACKSHYTKSLFHDIKACIYVNFSVQTSSNHWEDHYQ